MNPGVLAQLLLSGLSEGAVLGLVGLGFTLVAATVRAVHFAHGDVVIASVFGGVLLLLGRAPLATTLSPAAAVGFLALMLLIGAGLSVAVAAGALLPQVRRTGAGRTADVLPLVGCTVAAGLVIREAVGLALPQPAYAVPDLFRSAGGIFDRLLVLPGGATVPASTLGVLVVGLAVGAAVDAGLLRSRFGASVRALADDAEGAALCGVPVRRVLLGVFAVAGLLAGLAGGLAAPGQLLTVDSGVLLGLGGAAAAFLGGLGSPRGAIVGGLGVGLAQSVAVSAFGPGMHEVVPLVVLCALTVLRAPVPAARR